MPYVIVGFISLLTMLVLAALCFGWFKKWFCRHKHLSLVRQITSWRDEKEYKQGFRYEYLCKVCGKTIHK